jgi:hypothetical protein
VINSVREKQINKQTHQSAKTVFVSNQLKIILLDRGRRLICLIDLKREDCGAETVLDQPLIGYACSEQTSVDNVKTDHRQQRHGRWRLENSAPITEQRFNCQENPL